MEINMDEITTFAFRTSMGGFNKKDVNNYIASLSQSFAEKSKEYEASIESLNSVVDELKKNISALEAESVKSSELDALNEQLTQANSLLDARAKQVDSLTAERDELKAKLDAMTAKLSLFAGMEEKLGDYERMKIKMGELYLEAASSAERIKTDAENYAAAKRLSIDAEVTAIREERFKALSDLFDGITGELCAVIDGYRAKLSDFRITEDGVNKALEQFK